MKNLKKYLIAALILVIIAVAAFLISGNNNTENATDGAAKKQLRVGMECNYAPFNWTQTTASEYTVPIEGGMGYADGYDVQIAKKVADSLGMELVIVKTEWDGQYVGL